MRGRREAEESRLLRPQGALALRRSFTPSKHPNRALVRVWVLCLRQLAQPLTEVFAVDSAREAAGVPELLPTPPLQDLQEECPNCCGLPG